MCKIYAHWQYDIKFANTGFKFEEFKIIAYSYYVIWYKVELKKINN